MSRAWRRGWGPVGWIVLAMLVFLCLSVAAGRLRRLSGGEQLEIERGIGDWNALARSTVAPTAANRAAAAVHLEALQRQRRGLEAGLRAHGRWDAWDPSRGEQDLYFDILALIEEQRQAYATAGIALPAEASFGFSSVVRAQRVVLGAASGKASNPVSALIRLDRQRQAVAAILEALLRAEPERFLGIDRSGAGGPGTAGRRDSTGSGPPSLSSDDDPDGIGSTGYTLRFEGHTATLRTFLETLVEERRPLLVRSLAVRPAARETGGDDFPSEDVSSPFRALGEEIREGAEAAVPIVEGNRSIFTVALEDYVLPAGPEEGAR